MLEKYLDLMESSKEPKPEVLEDIRKTHGLSIPPGLHILHNKYPLEFPLIVNSSSLLYIMSAIAKENVLTLMDTVFSSRRLSEHPLWDQSVLVLFLYLDKSALPDILI